MNDAKVCNQCKEEKPLEMFFFKSKCNVVPSTTDLRISICKSCRNANVKRKSLEPKIVTSTTKVCTACKEEKPLEMFQINKVTKDGYSGKCKVCTAQYFQEVKDKTKERRKAAGSRNYQKHKEHIIKRTVDYRRTVLANNPYARLVMNLRGRTRAALKGVLKNDKTFVLTGCTPNELCKHLEGLFKDGMTWDNYGMKGWCVDHIVPCSAYDLSDPVEQKQCFHYTNLQPMWSSENFSKSDKWVV